MIFYRDLRVTTNDDDRDVKNYHQMGRAVEVIRDEPPYIGVQVVTQYGYILHIPEADMMKILRAIDEIEL